MNEFENKVVIVTGMTGIGRAIAKRLVSGGASVTACGIDEAADRELLQESDSSGYELRVELCDVSRPEQVQAIQMLDAHYRGPRAGDAALYSTGGGSGHSAAQTQARAAPTATSDQSSSPRIPPRALCL